MIKEKNYYRVFKMNINITLNKLDPRRNFIDVNFKLRVILWFIWVEQRIIFGKYQSE